MQHSFSQLLSEVRNLCLERLFAFPCLLFLFLVLRLEMVTESLELEQLALELCQLLLVLGARALALSCLFLHLLVKLINLGRVRNLEAADLLDQFLLHGCESQPINLIWTLSLRMGRG